MNGILSSSHTFRLMTDKDLPLLFRWVHEPHVKKWWDAESEWEEFRSRYTKNIHSENTFPYIVQFEGKSIGYINYWTTESDADFRDLFPTGSVGTDQFIGELDFVGKGHGAEVVKMFSDWLLTKIEIPLVMTDPDVENLSAIRCYQKAGFQILREMESAEGKILLMEKRK